MFKFSPPICLVNPQTVFFIINVSCFWICLLLLRFVCIVTFYNQDVVDILKTKYGHEVEKKERYMAVGIAISRDKRTGEITAFADERKIPGKAKLLTREIEVAELS